jgi:hypothetical protein
MSLTNFKPHQNSGNSAQEIWYVRVVTEEFSSSGLTVGGERSPRDKQKIIDLLARGGRDGSLPRGKRGLVLFE